MTTNLSGTVKKAILSEETSFELYKFKKSETSRIGETADFVLIGLHLVITDSIDSQAQST